MTRASNRAETRRKLIDATKAVYADLGWEGTSVALVAERAGFTTGAIYGSFDGKLDLLMTVLEERAEEIVAELGTRLDLATTPSERIGAIRDFYGQRLGRDRIGGRLTFDIVRRAYDDAAMRARLKGIYDRARSRVGEALASELARRKLPLPIAADKLAGIVIALLDGVLVQQIVDQDNAVFDAIFDLVGLVGFR
ncbi:MAG: TetR/AcrR family transcriptional regulator [Myxococcota bacterium]